MLFERAVHNIPRRTVPAAVQRYKQTDYDEIYLDSAAPLATLGKKYSDLKI